MKTNAVALSLLIPALAFAECPFTIGDAQCQLEFEMSGYGADFRKFVAEDLERVFAPLRSVSNVVDMAALDIPGKQGVGLTFREGYPGNFAGTFSISNAAGTLHFRMDSILSQRYEESYSLFPSVSNQVFSLIALLGEINDGTITNHPATTFPSLVFLPTERAGEATPERTQRLFFRLMDHAPLSVSVLDCWMETRQDEPRLFAASKAATKDIAGLNLDPIVWVWQNQTWKFIHPAFLKGLLDSE